MPERSNEGEANFVLSLLDEEIGREILTACTPVKLALGEKLVSAGMRIERVFFPSSGIASIVVVSKSGRRTEAGIVGKEGFVPAGVLAGAETSFTEVVVQAPGRALALDLQSFHALSARHRIFSDILMCALHVSRTQVECTAAANATCTVSQRLARWLLMCHDRVKGDQLQLTHDFLSMMLAVRRPSVTDALHILESQRFIRSERAKITVRNREALEVYARDLYGLPEAESMRVFARFLDETKSQTSDVSPSV
ncbi:Crp/Fnr family transcriptional regulator [Agrobacterium tumefaciens]|jgi:CRP-like cAMP-binding protein|uniref:Crp/Fnr family transcriptional regulator n=1 Tax=Agrobacterium sp. RS6 TaxID=2489001 RepID=UPI000FDF028A|nr:Crp/Fnr family transcriptional regulator [Agrobacterium sp. RS6]NSZ77118.1 Crp/Fnr family transcriptional regulator [Agrobacterium tumefaciens]NTA62098.1 Crp/Fnr family transcriptional regulator [Agrobacterium tumefaciens]